MSGGVEGAGGPSRVLPGSWEGGRLGGTGGAQGCVVTVTVPEVQSPPLRAADLSTLGQGLGNSYMLPSIFQTKMNSLIVRLGATYRVLQIVNNIYGSIVFS